MKNLLESIKGLGPARLAAAPRGAWAVGDRGVHQVVELLAPAILRDQVAVGRRADEVAADVADRAEPAGGVAAIGELVVTAGHDRAGKRMSQKNAGPTSLLSFALLGYLPLPQRQDVRPCVRMRYNQ